MTPRRTRQAEDTAEASVAEAPPAYAVDFQALEESGHSATFLVSSRLCWQCQQIFDERQGEEIDMKEYMARIADDCSHQADYLLPGTPLTEAVFRLLLAAKNRPMTIQEIQDQLSAAWANVIYMKDLSEELLTRLLETDNEYMIHRVS